jgi:hypothetical protein
VLWRAKQIKHSPSHCHCGSIPLTLKTRRRDICCSSKRGVGQRNCIRPTSKHHEVSIRLKDAKMNMILTFPSLLQLLTIDIDKGEEVWGVPCSSGRRDQPMNCDSCPTKHQEVSFGCEGKQCKQSTHLPLVSCAQCN